MEVCLEVNTGFLRTGFSIPITNAELELACLVEDDVSNVDALWLRKFNEIFDLGEDGINWVT